MKLSYAEQIQRKINKHLRAAGKLKLSSLSKTSEMQNHQLAVKYYNERLNSSACVSWEQFRGSWAGHEWITEQTKGN